MNNPRPSAVQAAIEWLEYIKSNSIHKDAVEASNTLDYIRQLETSAVLQAEHADIDWAEWAVTLQYKHPDDPNHVVRAVVKHNAKVLEDVAKLYSESQLAQRDSIIGELVEALDRAHDDMASWQSYAGPYFLEKHGADDDLLAIKNALTRARALTAQKEE